MNSTLEPRQAGRVIATALPMGGQNRREGTLLGGFGNLIDGN
ncbi:MAG TPA: hypothetical protein VFP14_00570 [Novosphingobium sp.]|nr:hypothetical protein [Novosphingobium sp.]